MYKIINRHRMESIDELLYSKDQ